MNVADFAREFHVTEQAVRNRVTRAGYVLDVLRKENSFEFSENGEKLVREIMSRPPAKREKKQHTAPTQERNVTITALRSELAAAHLAATKAEATAAAQQETIAILREELRDLKALLAAQQAQQPRITEGTGTAPEKKRFRWPWKKKH